MRVPVLLALASLVACAQPRVEPGAEPPATVEQTSDETELATVRLTPEAETRLGIETAQVAVQEIERRRTFGGDLVVPPGRSLVVAAPVAGRLLPPGGGAVPRPGVWVEANAEILRLIPLAPPNEDLVRQEAEADARLETARLQAARAETLRDERAASQRDYEMARAELAIAEATSTAVRTQVRALGRTTVDDPEGRLGAVPLAAPFRSRLAELFVAPGQLVSAGAPLFELLDQNPLWVRVPLYVDDVDTVDRARPATVHRFDDDGDAEATADFVSAPPSADPNAATVDLFLQLSNDAARFQPGQKVAVTVRLREAETSVVVPQSAIRYDIHGGTWVYARDAPQTYTRQRVEVRYVVDGLAVLARAPEPGTVIVTVAAPELFGTEFGVDH